MVVGNVERGMVWVLERVEIDSNSERERERERSGSGW